MSREYPSQPLIGLGAIVWKDDRVLMIKRGRPPGEGVWSLPGGLQMVGETVAEGIRREIAEETGVQIELLGLVEVIDSVRRDAAGQVQYHYTIIDYAARWIAGTAVAGDDAADVAWVAPDELDGLETWAETARVIEKSRRWLAQG